MVMVTYCVDSRDKTAVVYKYYPEDHSDKAYGLIRVDLNENTILLEKAAEEDFLSKASVKDFAEMREAINRLRLENGSSPLMEELPTVTEDEEWYYYAAHAIRNIKERLENGEIPEKGIAAWY